MVTDKGGYGRFGALSRVELERSFISTTRTGGWSRHDVGTTTGQTALQTVTVRQLSMFLPDPLDVPSELIDYLVQQLGIADSSCSEAVHRAGEDQARTRLGDSA